MNKQYSIQIVEFFNKYKIAKKISNDVLLKALEQTPTSGIGFSKYLEVNSSYITHDCLRKVDNILIQQKPKYMNWVHYILLLSNKCPVCDSIKNNLSSITCSYSCSNTLFRSGIDNGNYQGNNYRTICFTYHKKECVICLESNIVEVHHLDENKLNNEPKNLIPLCPTHHQYWHSSFKYLVEDKIFNYINNYQDVG